MLSSSPSASSIAPSSGSVDSYPGNHTVFSPISSEKMNLTEFVSQFHKSLPLPIRVCRGYCGPSEETSISEGDHFNVHFIKHTTVVLVEMENGYQYNVPLNSAVPFGILYDPQKNLQQANKGYNFSKVGDILQQPKLPHVVRARKSHTGTNSENSIDANELLLIRSAAKKRIGKNQLKVFSLTDRREKTLSENCVGHFSTKPRDVCVYLPDIVKYAPDIFPCAAILFASKESSQSLPTKLSSSVVTLMHHSIETSLVVTSALAEDGAEDAKMLDIPIDLNIQVRVATVTEVEAQKLARSTAYLYNNFTPSKLQSYVRTAQSQGMEDTQNLLYRTIRQDGQGKRGIKITRPQSIAISESDEASTSSSPHSYPISDIYDDIVPAEPHYMTPRPVGSLPSPGDSGPPLPGRNKTHTRTPGYSYVDVDMRRSAPARATRAVGPAASSVVCDRAPKDSSFGSTGSGSAVVERSSSHAAGDASSEYSKRSSYSEGDLEVRRQQSHPSPPQQASRQISAAVGDEKLRLQEMELDTFLMDLKDMTDGLDSVLQEKKDEGGDESYSTLKHSGPPQRKSSR